MHAHPRNPFLTNLLKRTVCCTLCNLFYIDAKCLPNSIFLIISCYFSYLKSSAIIKPFEKCQNSSKLCEKKFTHFCSWAPTCTKNAISVQVGVPHACTWVYLIKFQGVIRENRKAWLENYQELLWLCEEKWTVLGCFLAIFKRKWICIPKKAWPGSYPENYIEIQILSSN
jgi:hypothetical protein